MFDVPCVDHNAMENDAYIDGEFLNVEYLDYNAMENDSDIDGEFLNVEYLDQEDENLNTARSSNRIIDPEMFLNVLKSLEHNDGCLGPISSMQLQNEVRSGLNLRYKVSCSQCGSTSVKPQPVNSSNTNEVAVVGAMAAGLGYVGHKKQYDAINVPTMCERSYRQKSNKVGKNVLKYSKESMAKAAAIERDLAIQSGSLSSDGTPLITVILDGCFCKRSYGSNYSSLSGGACVIGLKTGLILDAEILNRYCHMCRINSKNVEHDCSFNYSGPASGAFLYFFFTS